ncbi:MAG: hypothetical protein GC165_07500 [Armatimonadetes bacterium]|nr:hypothetical protein [Armatimonadota bacterium]
MKRILMIVMAVLATASTFAKGGLDLAFRPVSVQPVLPQTYNFEAIYDRETRSAAVGVSAFWKTFSGVGPKKRSIDVFWFGGVDKAGVPVGAFTGKIPVTVADQLTFYVSPAFEIKQGHKGGLTLFAGFTLK